MWFVDKLGPRQTTELKTQAGAPAAKSAAPAAPRTSAPQAAAARSAPQPAEPPKKKKGWF